MSDSIRMKMTTTLLNLWYLNSELTEEIKDKGVKPETIEFNNALREKMDSLSEDTFLLLYNATLKKFYEL